MPMVLCCAVLSCFVLCRMIVFCSEMFSPIGIIKGSILSAVSCSVLFCPDLSDSMVRLRVKPLSMPIGIGLINQFKYFPKFFEH